MIVGLEASFSTAMTQAKGWLWKDSTLKMFTLRPERPSEHNACVALAGTYCVEDQKDTDCIGGSSCAPSETPGPRMIGGQGKDAAT